MKKMEGRAVLCLILAAALMIGLVFFIVRLAADGDQWASFYANQHVYYEGKLAVGSVYDRNGVTTPAIYIDANQHSITNLTIRNFTFAGQKILSEGSECEIYGDVDVKFE